MRDVHCASIVAWRNCVREPASERSPRAPRVAGNGATRGASGPLSFVTTEDPMSKPFDATLKDLLEVSPVGWAAALDYSVKGVDVVDADVSTVTGASDKML